MKIDYQKIIDDTLKEPCGKYSRKSLTMFVSVCMSVVLSFIIVLKYESSAELVLFAWLTMATGQSVLTLRDKFNQRKYDNKTNFNIDEVD